MTAELLAESSRRYWRRRGALRDATIELQADVRAARAAGMTLRAIAAATGLSFARIHQLTKEVPP